jgi:aerobic-type carbon monoxide dehydrogenase small subunit (CoxS/CutS family)
MRPLLQVLREDLELTGTKEGCGEGECGACAVFVEGVLVNSCLYPVLQADGAEITTIEGISSSTDLDPVQLAFTQYGGTQCGICTPGMVMASVNLLRGNPCPSESEIRQGLAGNLCRCTGYNGIVESVLRASESCPTRPK